MVTNGTLNSTAAKPRPASTWRNVSGWPISVPSAGNGKNWASRPSGMRTEKVAFSPSTLRERFASASGGRAFGKCARTFANTSAFAPFASPTGSFRVTSFPPGTQMSAHTSQSALPPSTTSPAAGSDAGGVTSVNSMTSPS